MLLVLPVQGNSLSWYRQCYDRLPWTTGSDARNSRRSCARAARRCAPRRVAWKWARAGARRGLRREEVSVLARVGITWYTWLEQGRDIQPSRDALRRIARALRLSPTDESYLFVLAGEGPVPPPPTKTFEVHPYLRAMMDTCRGACILCGPYLDVIAYNHAANVIFGYDDCEGPFGMNQGWRAFMNPRTRALYKDFDEVAARVVATFRASAASRSAPPALQRLVDDLRARSEVFERLWKDTAVQVAPLDRFEMELGHPRLGRLKLGRVPLLLATEPDLMLVTLLGADKRTADVLARLADEASRQRPRVSGAGTASAPRTSRRRAGRGDRRARAARRARRRRRRARRRGHRPRARRR